MSSSSSSSSPDDGGGGAEALSPTQGTDMGLEYRLSANGGDDGGDGRYGDRGRYDVGDGDGGGGGGGDDDSGGDNGNGGGEGEDDGEGALMPEEDILLSAPAFANAENREINERLIARNAALAREAAETIEHQNRIQVMSAHLDSLRIEMASAQKLLEAKTKEHKTEDHLAQLAERAVGRLRSDLLALENQTDGTQEMLSSVQAALYRGTEKLDKFRADMNWKQDELERWAVQARANEQNNLAIDEYTRGDEQRVRDLTRELERVTGLAEAKKRELDQDVTDTNARQVELDKLAEDFRVLHGERQDLIRQWQDSLAAIRARDEEIVRSGQRFADLRSSIQLRRSLIEEQDKRLASLEQENREMESRTEFLGRQMGLAREDLAATTKRVNDLRDEVEVLKTEVAAAAAELVQRRSENDNYAAEITAKDAKTAQLKLDLEETRQRLKDTKSSVSSLEEAVAKKELFLARETAAIEKKERDLAALKEAEYRARDTVAALRTEEEHTQGEIAGLRRTVKNLNDKVHELDAYSVKQQEHLYAAEFQIQQMERKIGRAKGEVSDEERVKLEARIAELNLELGEVKNTHKSLELEAKKVKQALLNATRRSDALSMQLGEVRARIDELLLQTRSGDESLRKAVRDKEEAMVSHDLLKLEVRKLRDALSNRTEDVFGLENRAAQLELSIEARKREIEAHRLVQRTQAKLAEEERHKLALDLAERSHRIVALKAKYETLCARMRGGAGDGGGAGAETGGQGQAYFVLQAAQKREEMQREGDELDRNIKRAEKEVRALAHTLQYLNTRNDSFRQAFARVEEGSDDANSVRALEAQANSAQDALFRRKRQLAQLVQEGDENARRLAGAADRVAGMAAQLQQLEAAATRVDAERQQQLVAVEQAQQRLEQARLRHRRTRRATASAPTADELAFVAQGLRDSNASVLFTLGQLAKGYPQLKPGLQALLSERNLRMPARPPSRVAGPGTGVTAASGSGGVASAAGASAFSAVTASAGAGGGAGAGGPPTPQHGGGGGRGSNIPVSPLTVPVGPSVRGTSAGGLGSGLGSGLGGTPRASSAGSSMGVRVPTPRAQRGGGAAAAPRAGIELGGLGVTGRAAPR